MSGKTRLADFSNPQYRVGAPKLIWALWHVIGYVFFSSFLPGSVWRRILLRTFGAKLGKGVIIKPGVIIKFPWKFSTGSHVWIGEKVWIDNLDAVHLEDNVCISQRATLVCGNHDYTSPTFDLITKPILIEEGAWVGSAAWVGPGTIIRSHAVLSANSTATGELEAYGIYTGNPAIHRKTRVIKP